MDTAMSECARFEPMLSRLRDDPETPISDDLALHLDACAACRRAFDAGKVELDEGAFEVLPVPVRRRILEELSAARAGWSRMVRTAWMLAASIFVLLAGGFALLELLDGGGSDDTLVAVLVEDHARYITHPDRRASVDRDSLVEYLQGYVDFPVQLPSPPEGELVGARRCSILDRRATLAFYDTPSGPVSYFVFPDDGLRLGERDCPGAAGLTCAVKHGYHVVGWRRVGLLHALVGTEPSTLVTMARACGALTHMEDPS